MDEQQEAMLEVKRMGRELKDALRYRDYQTIYQLCKAIVVTIEEADLEDGEGINVGDY